ncbi:hypothetical protein [Variovorax ginsengisoli]|uniref:Uncharacterized protein n=1 Tax=Variovorax ginsengisoli TaxID=363844 RepID=A0ABT8SBL2_9BURK|nr:hypothetical protein [Variovorax ginsengisoli]MDN8617137.1 hypothetical protein [Variovorax ginsengisoli]MDO1536307.1 hypothetical protein [Variovorax ginsengisoli]
MPTNETPQPSVLDSAFSTVNLRITKAYPAKIEQTFYEGERQLQYSPSSFSPWLDFEGDMSLIIGPPSIPKLYLALEDPAGRLFRNEVVEALWGGSTMPPRGTMTSNLKKNATLIEPPTGRYTGEILLYACMDARCSVRFENAPIKVPYDVIVKPNTRFVETGTSQIAVSIPFSRASSQFSVQVIIRGDSVAWPPDPLKYELTDPRVLPDAKAVMGPVPNNNLGVGQLDVTVPGMTPGGTYKLAYQIGGRIMTINLAVVANPAEAYAFEPTSMIVEAPANPGAAGASYSEVKRLKVSYGEGTMTYAGVDFLDANGTPTAPPINFRPSGAQSTFNVSAGSSGAILGSELPFSVLACNFPTVGAGAVCIPFGTYPVRMRFNHAVNGVVKEVYYPITLIVRPWSA